MTQTFLIFSWGEAAESTRVVRKLQQIRKRKGLATPRGWYNEPDIGREMMNKANTGLMPANFKKKLSTE